MKKKAIKTAGSYDEFKNLVACAQQKPVERGSLLSFTEAKVTKNRVAGGGRAGGSAGPSSALLSSPVTSNSGPKNLLEFTRDWRRCKTAQQRFVYVGSLPAKSVRRVFSSEFDSVVFGEIVACFQECLSSGSEIEGWDQGPDATCRLVFDILAVFPAGPGFGLGLDLLTPDDVSRLQSVLAILRSRCPEKDSSSLERTYRVPA
jgi:hypothetical protein